MAAAEGGMGGGGLRLEDSIDAMALKLWFSITLLARVSTSPSSSSGGGIKRLLTCWSNARHFHRGGGGVLSSALTHWQLFVKCRSDSEGRARLGAAAVNPF
jgi:hypothetical protein